MSAENASPTTPFLLRVAENLDPRVLLPALLLTGVGLTSLASTRSDLVGTQVSGIVVGVAAATALVLLPYKTVLRLAWPVWIASLLLLKDFRLIGKPVPRLDVPAKIRGAAVYGIDVRVPGMLHAVVARPPALGGKVARFDAARALAVPGGRKVVEVPSGVAVVLPE